jgi:hypothetical protein
VEGFCTEPLALIALKTQHFTASLAYGKTGISWQRAGGIGHRITGIVEAHGGLIQLVAALFAGPDEAIQFLRRAFPFDYKSPGAFGAARRIRNISGQKKNFAGFEQRELTLLLRIDVVEIEFAFELVQDFISAIDVKILAVVLPARDKSNEIRVFSDHAALSPVVAVVIDPLPEIKAG